MCQLCSRCPRIMCNFLTSFYFYGTENAPYLLFKKKIEMYIKIPCNTGLAELSRLFIKQLSFLQSKRNKMSWLVLSAITKNANAHIIYIKGKKILYDEFIYEFFSTIDSKTLLKNLLFSGKPCKNWNRVITTVFLSRVYFCVIFPNIYE